jgi:molybdate transport system ATP-binding protein
VLLVQLVSRAEDVLPFIQDSAFLKENQLVGFPDYSPPATTAQWDVFRIPENPNSYPGIPEVLVDMQEISLKYGETPILNQITWQIKKGAFWELRGPNGSGKSTLITLISGDNPKAYGMNLSLFGTKKGSGESVWDIKGLIGYFTPGMIDRFRGYHSTENMLISGLLDSIGLYVIPGDGQRALAQKWLKMLNMEEFSNVQFCDLTAGQQRLIFCARAMIKHPPLLILDEPTAGLDALAAAQVVGLINKMAKESDTAILFVSHRNEPGLKADHIFELVPGSAGSKGVIR